jgi:hypothetical protein
VFARGVDADAALADESRGGRGVHDGAAAGRQHRRNFVFHAEKYTLQIDVDEAIPGDFFFVGNGKPAGADAGIVEGDIQAAIGRNRALHHGAAIAFTANIAAHGDGLAAGVLDQRGGLLHIGLVLVHDHHAPALFGEKKSSRPSDPRPCACDEDGPINKTAAHNGFPPGLCGQISTVQYIGFCPRRVGLAGKANTAALHHAGAVSEPLKASVFADG